MLSFSNDERPAAWRFDPPASRLPDIPFLRGIG